MVSSWELIASFLSTVSPHSNLKDLSISVYLAVPSSGEVRIYFTKECEFVLENAEALDLILDNSFKGLLTLDLYLNLHWGPEFRNKSEWIRIKLSQSAVEEALRKKLSRISKRASVTVSMDYHFMGDHLE